MKTRIISAEVTQDEQGKYTLTIVDYLNDTTHEELVPDQYVSYLPLILQEVQRRLGSGG